MDQHAIDDHDALGINLQPPVVPGQPSSSHRRKLRGACAITIDGASP
jgi:hypothetical protein